MVLAERLEAQQRVNRGLMYRVFGQLADPPDEIGPAAGWVQRAAERLRLTPGEVRRRARAAARILPRRQVCGPPLPPALPLLAQAVAGGIIGEDHLRVISTAMDRLPGCVSGAERAEVEASLVREAAKSDAEIVRAAGGTTDADHLFFACGPDHKLLTEGHYRTHITDTGRLAWTDGTTPPRTHPGSTTPPPPRRNSSATTPTHPTPASATTYPARYLSWESPEPGKRNAQRAA